MADRIPLDKGPYLCAYGRGGAHGPLRQPSVSVGLVYGPPVTNEFWPVDMVRPIERAYEILQYTSPAAAGQVWIVRFDLSHIVWGALDTATPVPSTPELKRIFDETLERYHEESEVWIDRMWVLYEQGMNAVGLTMERAEQVLAEDKRDGTHRYVAEIWDVARQHVPEKPGALLIKAEGIDHILEPIPISHI